MAPLADLAPDLRHPVLRKTVRELLDARTSKAYPSRPLAVPLLAAQQTFHQPAGRLAHAFHFVFHHRLDVRVKHRLRAGAAHRERDRLIIERGGKSAGVHRRLHFEIKSIVRIDHTAAGDFADRRQHQFQILRGNAVGCHPHAAAELFDLVRPELLLIPTGFSIPGILLDRLKPANLVLLMLSVPTITSLSTGP